MMVTPRQAQIAERRATRRRQLDEHRDVRDFIVALEQAIPLPDAGFVLYGWPAYIHPARPLLLGVSQAQMTADGEMLRPLVELAQIDPDPDDSAVHRIAQGHYTRMRDNMGMVPPGVADQLRWLFSRPLLERIASYSPFSNGRWKGVF